MGYRDTQQHTANRRRLLILFAVLTVIGGVSLYFALRPQPTPEERIEAAIKKSQVAAVRGDIGGTVAVVSNHFQAGSLNKARLRLILFRVRQESRGTTWRVDVDPIRILPSGDNAPDKRIVITRIAIRDATSGDILWSTGDAAITLIMEKESDKILGVFPTSEWRVVAAPSLPDF